MKCRPLLVTLLLFGSPSLTEVVANHGGHIYDRGAQSKPKHDYQTEAYFIAQEFVRRRLKAPASAIFSPRSQTRIVGSYHAWNVFGYVDAQNSYGAWLRMHYEASFDRTEDGRWRPHYVKFK